MNPWVSHLKNFYHIGVEAQEALEKNLYSQEYEKDQFLHQEGQICRKLHFIESGCVRGFHYKEGKEVTNWFGFESDFVTSFHSFIDQHPGFEYIQALEKTKVWIISRDTLYKLYDSYPPIERLGRITCEQYYIRLEDRHVSSHFKSAADRYENLITRFPHIIQRIPLGYIASFLGISQETLSRIRSKPTS